MYSPTLLNFEVQNHGITLDDPEIPENYIRFSWNLLSNQNCKPKPISFEQMRPWSCMTGLHVASVFPSAPGDHPIPVRTPCQMSVLPNPSILSFVRYSAMYDVQDKTDVSFSCTSGNYFVKVTCKHRVGRQRILLRGWYSRPEGDGSEKQWSRYSRVFWFYQWGR